MFNIKRFFFPHDAYTKSVMSTLKNSTTGLSVRDIYLTLSPPDKLSALALGRVSTTIGRLRDRKLVYANSQRVLTSNPPRCANLYKLTEEGKAFLKNNQ